MERKPVIKWREVTRVMNHSRLKQTIAETFLSDELLREVMVADVTGSLSQVVVFPLDKDYTAPTFQSTCVHGFEDLGNGYSKVITDPIEIKFATHIAYKCDIFTGKCPKCGRIHVGVRHYESGQKRINY